LDISQKNGLDARGFRAYTETKQKRNRKMI
jgi:hypothetical protein